MNYCESGFRCSRAAWIMDTNNTIALPEIASQELQKGLRPPALDQAIRQRALHRFQIDAHMEQLASSDNRITLDWNRRNRSGQPGIRLRYGYGDH